MGKQSSTGNSVRIIAGQFRHRKLQFPDAPGLRPTGDRIRETLFNWLQDWVAGANCLDLFAGSGALAIEALSRGAAYAEIVDSDSAVARALQDNMQVLGINNASVKRMTAEAWLQSMSQTQRRFDLVFLDPPFVDSRLPELAHALEQADIMTDQCRIYLESGSELDYQSLPENWQELRHKKSGQVYYYLFERSH